MSAQFGRWNFDGQPTGDAYLAQATALISPYGPDGSHSYSIDGVNIEYRYFHTTEESPREIHPHITPSGAVITWDGRLDNRDELLHPFQGVLTNASTDLSIVAAAYDKWGIKCLSKLVGDWALAILEPTTRTLILATDPIGTRHLFYAFDKKQVTWSTILDPIVLLADRSLTLCEEYVAGWYAFLPAAHLTPYFGVHRVPPSHAVFVQPGKQVVREYWAFDPAKQIRYNCDQQYEEHFLAVFKQAVRRRLRSNRPILAELSGGMDSSSVVCMADIVMAEGAAATPRLDTVSYFNNSEPNWDERPYFTKVEQRRGRSGCHIDVSSEEPFILDSQSIHFSTTPGSDKSFSNATAQFSNCMTSQNNRVVLSGIGGDEVMGGIPSATPELMNLLARPRFGTLYHQLHTWALNKRKPWFHLLFETIRPFLSPAIIRSPKLKQSPAWLDREFVRRNRSALSGYETRLKVLGPLPSFQENLHALQTLRRQLASFVLSSHSLCERSYPYLDRDLLEFLYAIPPEQLVRPGQRRSLMRRALRGTVPDEILNRKRKAFVSRAPLTFITEHLSGLLDISKNMTSETLGIVDAKRFVQALAAVSQQQSAATLTLLRTIGIELWLRGLKTSSQAELNLNPHGKRLLQEART
jgi:asparagine synthase (glutamine-hydrolysing)